MKALRALAAFVLLAAFLTGSAAAENDTQTDEGLSQVQEALPDEAAEILDGVSAADSDAGEKGVDAIIDAIKNSTGVLKSAVKSAVAIMVIVLLCSVVASALNDGAPKDAAMLVSIIAVAAVAAGNISTFIGLGKQTLYTLSDFSKVLLPTMCSAAAASGAITSAAAKYAATALFMDVLLNLGIKVVLPLIMLYLTAVISGAALGRDTLSNIAKLLKWLCTITLTLLISAFTLYLSVTGIITGKSDEAAVKVTKLAIGTLLPVVGDTVASAAETLVAGAGLVRNAIGVFGMIGVAAVCVTPFLTIGAHYLAYKGVAALSLAITDKRIAELIDGVGTAFGMVLALVGAAGVFIFISLLSSMKAVTG